MSLPQMYLDFSPKERSGPSMLKYLCERVSLDQYNTTNPHLQRVSTAITSGVIYQIFHFSISKISVKKYEICTIHATLANWRSVTISLLDVLVLYALLNPREVDCRLKISKLQNQQCSFARDLLCHNAKDKRIGFHIQKGHQRKALLSVLFKKKNIILSKNF